MKRVRLLLLLQVAVFEGSADEYKDPLSNVIYTYVPAGGRAEVKQGEEWIDTDDGEIGVDKPGSPNANTEIVILDRFTIDGKEYIVDKIGELAFVNMTYITSVAIPSSVKSIGYKAFMGCASLSTVVLSEGLETIQWAAFNSTRVSSITIPSSVQSIESMAFASRAITTITSLIENPFQVLDICRPTEKKQVILRVPIDTKSKYMETPDWNQFGTIEEFLPTSITSSTKHQNPIDYDLSGRRIPPSSTLKGVYIQNGRKLMVRSASH